MDERRELRESLDRELASVQATDVARERLRRRLAEESPAPRRRVVAWAVPLATAAAVAAAVLIPAALRDSPDDVSPVPPAGPGVSSPATPGPTTPGPTPSVSTTPDPASPVPGETTPIGPPASPATEAPGVPSRTRTIEPEPGGTRSLSGPVPTATGETRAAAALSSSTELPGTTPRATPAS